MAYVLRTLYPLDLGPLAGATASHGAAFIWGARLARCDLAASGPALLRGAEGPPFGEGGCRDGEDLVLTEAGASPALIRWGLAGGIRRLIDRGVMARDAATVTLDGRRGVLVVHRGVQLRFYDSSGGEARDVYSFYSPSEQGGLWVTDLDGDERRDLVCGNYWVRQPDRFDLPWRLFAIKTWADGPLAAVCSFASVGGALYAAQRALPAARLSRFDRALDPRELWTERRLEGDLNLVGPRLCASGADLICGEGGGLGRLLIFHDGVRSEPIGAGSGVVHLAEVDGRILVVRQTGIAWLERS